MELNVFRLPAQIEIGYVGENDARAVSLDWSDWAEQYGAGVLTVLFQRHGDDAPYPVVTETEGTITTWAPSATDTAVPGYGRIQLRYSAGDVIAKSEILGVMVGKSLTAEGDPPDPYESWLDTLTDLASETEQNAQAAAQSATEAETSASSAAGSVAQAHLYATQAGNSASSASDSAVDAQRHAQAASASETNAALYESNAQGYALRAETAQTRAESAQTASESARDTAVASSSSASESATSAGASASSAESSASSAASSASSAGQYATSAGESAQSASGSASSASESASSATQSATQAGQSASSASASATQASGSASSASASATAAATSETNAAQSATEAEAAQAGAETAQSAAEAVLESIPADYSELSDEVDDLKSALTYVETVTDFTLGRYLNNRGDVGAVVFLDYVDSSSYNCVLLEVRKGESFTITGLGGNAARLWCLTDTDKRVVAIADANVNASGVTVEITANGYLACDFYTSVTPSLTINRLITADEVKEIEEEVDELNDNVLGNLGGEKVVNLPLVTGYVDYNNGNLSDYDDNNKYKRTGKMAIPDGTDEIIIDSTFNASAGWAVYDSNQTFIAGGTSKRIAIQSVYKYIAISSFDSTGIHSDRTVTYVYKSVLQTVISCWGDSITEGMSLDGNHSAEYGKAPYPAQLNTIMTDNGYKDFTVNNYGHGGECMPDVMARLGAVCAVFIEDVVVPGDGTTVTIGTHAESGGLRTDSKIQIPFKNKNGTNYNVALTQLSHDTNPITINGDHYSLSISSQTIYLSQTTGTAITIPKGSLMFTADNRNSTIDIVYAGVNDAISLTLELYLKFMAKVAEKNPKYLCIGCQNALFQYWSDLSGTVAEKYEAYSEACTEQMGVHFVDLYQEFYPVALKYALEGGYFTGKTAEELAAMEALLAQKIMPAEFSYDEAHQGNVHLNAAGYYVMARIIYNRLAALNYI